MSSWLVGVQPPNQAIIPSASLTVMADANTAEGFICHLVQNDPSDTRRMPRLTDACQTTRMRITIQACECWPHERWLDKLPHIVLAVID
jgi:hypothetical protein